MNKVKYIVWVLLCGLVLYAGFKIFVRLKTQYEICITLTSPRYLERLASFNNMEIDSNSIVFIGNSLIEGFDLSVFNNPHTVNRGISGDFTSGVIARIDSVLKRHPKKVFVEIGINDLIEKVPLKTMLANYDTILQKITAQCPTAKIYVHSLLPTKLNGSLLTPSSDVNARVVEFNAQLLVLSQKHHCTYIDTWSHFTAKDNSMNPAITTDGIHLTEDGYKIWVGLIVKMVNE